MSRTVSKSVKPPAIKIFGDGADALSMQRAALKGTVQGFTTNPTLMKKAGVTDYFRFGREVLAAITTLPVSFEVISDDFPGMEREARQLASWGQNVYVKIPITNTAGESSLPLIEHLSADGLKLNVTAVLSWPQIQQAAAALSPATPAILSVFAGRIADTGRDPVPIMRKAAKLLRDTPNIELLWASPREVYNVFQAAKAGCHIITLTDDLLRKLGTIGTPLDDLSLATVRMFFQDARSAGIRL